jgi:hypothetical protein
MRIVPAIILLVLGWLNGPNYWVLALGVLVLFSAFYDQCSLCKVVKAQVQEIFKKKPA